MESVDLSFIWLLMSVYQIARGENMSDGPQDRQFNLSNKLLVVIVVVEVV